MINYGAVFGILIMVNDEDLSTKARGAMTEIAVERTIEDVSMLKALADPIRLLLLELTMAEPERTWTARELAAQANVLPTNIYYHLNMLERQGLLQVRDTRVVNGIIEKHYGTGQRTLTFRRRSSEGQEGFRELVAAMISRVQEQIDAGLASGSMSGDRHAPERERMMVTTGTVRIPEDEVAQFREELMEIVARYEDQDRGGHRFTVMAAIYPQLKESFQVRREVVKK